MNNRKSAMNGRKDNDSRRRRKNALVSLLKESLASGLRLRRKLSSPRKRSM